MVRTRLPREMERRFWRLIRDGMSTDEAGVVAGASMQTGRVWFRDAGGMPPFDLAEPSGRYLCFAEREDLSLYNAAGLDDAQMGRLMGRHPSTIGRELTNNSPAGGRKFYKASIAQAKADARGRRPKLGKLASDPALHKYVQEKLLCLQHWSPEQISHGIVADFPDDEQMRISHEAIYQSIYIQGRGGLRRELASCLRTGRALRKPQARSGERRSRILDMVMITDRPAEVDDRAIPGHWEGDLIIGKNGASAIGTLVERTTRYLLLIHLGGDRSAPTVRDAIAAAILTMPEQLRKTLTWDQGRELTEHTQLSIDADLDIYFCDPHSPWPRGTNENTNGLLRQYYPKGTDLSVHSPQQLREVAAALNGRPRKTLGWKTPAEALALLLSN
jgi:IS30 family transposase